MIRVFMGTRENIMRVLLKPIQLKNKSTRDPSVSTEISKAALNWHGKESGQRIKMAQRAPFLFSAKLS